LLDEVLFHPKRLRIAIILYLTEPKPLSMLKRDLGLSLGDLYTQLKRLEERLSPPREKVHTTWPKNIC